MKEQSKTILILVGRGKSTLTRWILDLLENEGKPWLGILLGVRELIKDSDAIKKEVSSGFRYIVHLESEEQIKKIPLGIKRRALIYKLDF